VPFGVAFTFITVIANYRAIRHDHADALLLAQRWSKVAAVLFAVGAVSGTVPSFEMGLLWPRLMGRFGAAYGIPFAVEGIFVFLEAIFVAVYTVVALLLTRDAVQTSGNLWPLFAGATSSTAPAERL
jgi:cytochrome d ubiquinol oxidase subunit I